MARTTATEADDQAADPTPDVTPAEVAAAADVPVPIDVSGLDFEAHVASVQGGYTVTTEA